jgi:hypothetical protein
MLYGIAHRGECHDGVGEAENSPSYDVILQAFCGIMSMTGDEDGGYIRSPISPIDQMTGVHAFSGILASLYAREKQAREARSRFHFSKPRLACWVTICRPIGDAAFSRRNVVQARSRFAPIRPSRLSMARS